jgi:hypothetical protein
LSSPTRPRFADGYFEFGQGTVMDEFVAHLHTDGRVHPLGEHLGEVGRLTSEFVGGDAARPIARLAGLWHDT